jgi:molybdenum-dependent DNA-binding transcriptional regulator ModE
MRTRRDLPSLRQLRAFEAVACCNSIGGGAKELGLSQPAVTQMIFQLETALAAKLLKRRRSGSFLTPFGDVLLTRVQRLFAQIQSALSDPAIGASLSGRETTKSVESKITDTHIRTLTAIAESGSFEAAGRRLNISQPTLHRSARDLERVLRRSLYQRMARGLGPTSQARELARRLKVALTEVEYGIEELRAAQGIFSSRIRIGNRRHRNHVSGNLQIHPLDNEHGRTALDGRSAARRSLDHSFLPLACTGQERRRGKPGGLEADRFASTVSYTVAKASAAIATNSS